jgi:hypothetical protein
MIDLSSEVLVPLNKVRVPGRPSLATRWRWTAVGVRGVRLESIMVGGQRFTTEQAVNRFIAALNAPGALPETRDHKAEKAGKALQAAGC